LKDPVPNKQEFLIIISAKDQNGANQRLETAIRANGYEDDCGLMSGVRLISVSEDVEMLLKRVTKHISSSDSLVIAPLAGGWVAQNAKTVDDCGKL
jgi:hypothetical protein